MFSLLFIVFQVRKQDVSKLLGLLQGISSQVSKCKHEQKNDMNYEYA